MRRVILGLAAVLALTLVPGQAQAKHCGQEVTAIGPFYFVNRGATHQQGGTWLYYENNNQEGLQTGGTSLLGDPDPCGTSATPDLLIF